MRERIILILGIAVGVVAPVIAVGAVLYLAR
jgi:hypothetical protein